MSNTIVYKITCDVNNKFYIGITNYSLNHRWNGHKTDSKRDRCNNKFYNALTKYGFDNFKQEILFVAFDREYASQLEKYFIREYNTIKNGYNSTLGGDNEFLHSEETKEKLRQANLGKKLSKETRKKISEAVSGDKNGFYGRKHSDETKRKIGDANSHPQTDEFKKKISEAVSGDKHPYFKGYCVTPWGKHASAKLAAEACPCGIKEPIIYWICHRNFNKIITRKNKTMELLEFNDYVGKNYADFGFGFEPKSER